MSDKYLLRVVNIFIVAAHEIKPVGDALSQKRDVDVPVA
jgi:hypothetical protein